MKKAIRGSSRPLWPPSALNSGDHVASAPETGGRRESPAQALDDQAPAVYEPPITCQSIVESSAAVKSSPRAILLYAMAKLKEHKTLSNRDEVVAIARHGIEKFASGHGRYKHPPRSMKQILEELLRVFAINSNGSDFADQPAQIDINGFRTYCVAALAEKLALGHNTVSWALSRWAKAGVIERRQDINLPQDYSGPGEFTFNPWVLRDIHQDYVGLKKLQRSEKSKNFRPRNASLSEYFPQSVPEPKTPELPVSSEGEQHAMLRSKTTVFDQVPQHAMHCALFISNTPSRVVDGPSMCVDVPSVSVTTTVLPLSSPKKEVITGAVNDLFPKKAENIVLSDSRKSEVGAAEGSESAPATPGIVPATPSAVNLSLVQQPGTWANQSGIPAGRAFLANDQFVVPEVVVEPEIDPETGETKIVPPGEEPSPVRLISENPKFEQIINILRAQYPEVEYLNLSQRQRVRRLTFQYSMLAPLTVETARELVLLRQSEIENGGKFFAGFSRITRFLDLIKHWRKIATIISRSLHSAYDNFIVGLASGIGDLRELLLAKAEKYAGFVGLFDIARNIPNFETMWKFSDSLKSGLVHESTEVSRATLRGAFLNNAGAYSFLVEKFPQVQQLCGMSSLEHYRLTRDFQNTCERIKLWGLLRSDFGFDD